MSLFISIVRRTRLGGWSKTAEGRWRLRSCINRLFHRLACSVFAFALLMSMITAYSNKCKYVTTINWKIGQAKLHGYYVAYLYVANATDISLRKYILAISSATHTHKQYELSESEAFITSHNFMLSRWKIFSCFGASDSTERFFCHFAGSNAVVVLVSFCDGNGCCFVEQRSFFRRFKNDLGGWEKGEFILRVHKLP